MSEELLNHNQEKSPQLPGEEHPGAAGGVGAERSEPERSDGERSGAPTPPAAPPPTVSAVGPWGDEEAAEVGKQPLCDDAGAESVTDGGGLGLSGLPRLSGRSKGGRRLVKKEQAKPISPTVEQRLWLLDTWKRSELPAADFAAGIFTSITP